MTALVHSATPRPLLSHFNPVTAVRSLWANRELTRQMARRQLEARYKAQALGLLWTIITPLVMLAIYTFVFTVVFESKWGDDARRGEFALQMFLGLLVFGLFRDVALHAPALVVGHRNYVKRVVFPLEVLSVADLLVSIVTFAIGLAVWLVGWAAIMQQPPHWQGLILPVLLLPVCLAALGVSWFLAALGAFLRDVGNLVELAVNMLLFLTPVFYNLERVPEPYRAWLRYNPLAGVIESARAAMMRGEWPGWSWWAASLAASALIAIGGYGFFSKSRRAFADVV